MAKLAVGPVRRKFAPWNDPAAKPFIEFRHVTKRFGDFVAVDDVSLAVYEREFFALLGPSGCGKTTMMRMVAGFDEPSAGEIMLDGNDLAGVPPYRRPSNMMFQSYALFPHMTVEANIAFGLKQDGMAKNDIAVRVAEMLKMVKLEPFAKRKPHQLSGGQRQRVALARSLAKKPKVLLLDEPLGALDKKLREETQFELTDLQVDLGLTFVIVTHDQEEAMTLADRIAVMNHGKIVQVGTPAEIYEQPNSKYVADFIGNINLIEGKVASTAGGSVTLDCVGTGAKVVVHQDLTANTGSVAWFAVRPEKIGVSLTAPADRAVNAVAGKVWDIGYLGDISVYHVRLASGATLKATVTNSTRLVERPITWDDEVWLTWSADSGVVLSKLKGATGMANKGGAGRGGKGQEGWARFLVLALPYAWLLVLFLVPFLIVVKISLSTSLIGQPPYTPTFDITGGLSGLAASARQLVVDNYVFLTKDALYWKAYLSSLWIALASTFLVLIFSYPIAYGMARASRAMQPTLVMLIILPFWTSFLIRVYAWIGILKKEGLLNQLLMWLHLIDHPLTILNTNWAVYIGIVYSYMPFMILPLYATLERLDNTLLEAASDLGSPPLKSFWQITFPLSLPGVIAGSFLVFIPVTGEFVIPDLLGGHGTLMIGKTLWDEFFANRDWPLASAVAVVLLILLVVPIVIFQNQEQKRAEREK